MLKTFRKNTFINNFVRNILITSKKSISKITPRWRISGEVDLSIDGTNFKMFSACDDPIVDALYYNADRYSELQELTLFAKLAARSKFILDIGANTGFYSVCANARNKDAVIWAFEPFESNAIRLRKNLAINDAKNVCVFQKAVGDLSKSILISVPDTDQICDSVSADAEFAGRFYQDSIVYKQTEVEQIKLDDLEFTSQIDLIKIDVENYELAVLNGAVKTLDHHSPVIQCEIIEIDETRSKFYEDVLKPLGYNCYAMLKHGLLYSETLQPNLEGRDYLFSKKKLFNLYTSYSDETLPKQLI